MSQPAFEMVVSMLDIWKIVIQAIMFLALWVAVFTEKKRKRDGIAAALFILANAGIGLENVRDIAERYFGGVNIKVKGDVFHVTVMLQQGEVGEGK